MQLSALSLGQEKFRMKTRVGTAFGLGITAAAVVTLVMIPLRAAELTRLDLEMISGAMLTRTAGPLTWAIGCGIHLLAGGLFAVIYGRIFEAWGGAGWRRGMAVAVVHNLVAGTLLAMVPAIQPGVPEHPLLPAPGFMAIQYGPLAAATFLALHLLFGLIVGGSYPVRAPARRAPMSHGPA